MTPFNTSSADDLGHRIAALIDSGSTAWAFELLAPVLSSKTAFHLLDRIGAQIGEGPLPETNEFLAKLAGGKATGAWPLVGSALAAQLDRDFEGALDRCRACIISGGVWYAADTLAERVPGHALVADFGRALSHLARWRSDPDRWVRKSAGVAVHLWTKRSRGDANHLPQVKELLAYLAPMFSEQDLAAVKGVGWALKTLGRNYPAAVTPWLERMVAGRREHRALMLRKALTYLPEPQRRRVLRAAAR